MVQESEESGIDERDWWEDKEVAREFPGGPKLCRESGRVPDWPD